MIRPFVLLDLPKLHKYRHKGLFLDTTTALTWGPRVVPAGAFLTHLAPATGVFTFLGAQDGDEKKLVIAQLVHQGNTTAARFSFLAPESALNSSAFSQMVEYAATQVGQRGAHNLVAEVDEGKLGFEVLRSTGFAIYARQRIWKFDETQEIEGSADIWRVVRSKDGIPVRVLYNNLVPPLTQQVESPPWERMRGLVYCQGDELLGYVNLTYGPRGVMIHPYFHPDTEQVTACLAGMLAAIPNRRSRSLYVCVRSYQGWLEAALDELNAQPGPRQAVMVKRLVSPVQKPVLKPIPSLKGTSPANPTVPFDNSFVDSVDPQAVRQKRCYPV
jgi:hypothetical protein